VTARVRILVPSPGKSDALLDEAEALLNRTGRRYAAALERVTLSGPRIPRGGPASEMREAEALRTRSEGCTRVALVVEGTTFASSHAFAKALEDLLARGRPVAFLVGGPSGLAPALRAEADARWSLSSLTFPHRLAVLLVAEQIYRAHEIERGGPYAR